MFAFDLQRQLNRRLFLRNGSVGIGVAALATLLERDAHGAGQLTHHGLAELPHFPAKARRVIWLTQAGAAVAARSLRLQTPSQRAI